MADRTRVGVVGCGLIAQVMHLPYLTELSDRFEVAALCDIRETVAEGCAERFGLPRVLARWEDLLEERLDAVLIATSGDHAPIAIEAAGAGMHVLVEKPMALSSAGAEEMARAAERAGVCLMVGTMKRYDPAYERLAELLPTVDDLRLVRVSTLESPFAPYVAHYPLIGMDGPVSDPVVGEHERDALEAALGDVDEETRWCYRWILLDNLVHEFNMLGGLLGAPDEVRFAHLSRRLGGPSSTGRAAVRPPGCGTFQTTGRTLPPACVNCNPGGTSSPTPGGKLSASPRPRPLTGVWRKRSAYATKSATPTVW